MNRPVDKYIQRKLDQAVDKDDLRRWKEVKDREIWKQKIEKSRLKEVKLKLKLFYDNLQYKNNKYKIAKNFSKCKNICYVYFLIDYDEIVYVGKSINYEARITAHGFDYNLIRVIKTNEELGEKWETKLIKKYQPIHNKNGINVYKAYRKLKKGDMYSLGMVRKYDSVKPRLNLKFKETYIKKKYYTYKDARSIYYNFDDLIKSCKVKFWAYDDTSDKRIIFYSHKPINKKLFYPITKKPKDIEDEGISNTS